MSVLLARGNTMLVLPFDQGLASVIPHARTLDYEGRRMLVVPNRHHEAKLARNLGHAVPPTILTNYDWAGNKPWDVQRVTAAMMTENPRLYVLNSMGTGKTLSALFAVDFLMKQGLAKRALVTAPLSTLTPVWETEVRRYMPHRTVATLHGTPEKRRAALAKGTDICVVNHHGLALLANELKGQFEIVVIDELAVFRNKQTKLWSSAATVIDQVPWVWGLTGSPTPMAPTDAWAQCRLLTPASVPRSMTAFRSQVMTQVSQFRWLPRPDATTVVHNAMQPAVRFTRDDVMELPEHSVVDREVSLDPVVAEAYKRMAQRLRMNMAAGEEITAANEGVLHSKLLQIAMGWVYTNDKKVYELPSKARLDALTEVVTESEHKVIVFVPFVHALKGVSERLQKEGFDTAVVHGGVSRGERDRIFTGFQHGASPRVLVAHPRTMAHGLTLTAADTIVWYSPYPDLEIYEQANARITRPGQKHKTLIVHLHGGVAVEKTTYRRLRERAKMQGLLLDMFASQETTF